MVVGAALLATVIAVSAAALRDADNQSLTTAEFTFDYPREWKRVPGVELPLAEQAGRHDVGRYTVGPGRDSWVTVYTTYTEFDVTDANVSDLLPAVRELFSELATANGGRMLDEPRVVRAAGMPGVRVRLRVRSTRGVTVEDELTQLFDARRAYVVNCQSGPEDGAVIAAGCDTVLESLEGRRP